MIRIRLIIGIIALKQKVISSMGGGVESLSCFIDQELVIACTVIPNKDAGATDYSYTLVRACGLGLMGPNKCETAVTL